MCIPARINTQAPTTSGHLSMPHKPTFYLDMWDNVESKRECQVAGRLAPRAGVSSVTLLHSNNNNVTNYVCNVSKIGRHFATLDVSTIFYSNTAYSLNWFHFQFETIGVHRATTRTTLKNRKNYFYSKIIFRA